MSMRRNRRIVPAALAALIVLPAGALILTTARLRAAETRAATAESSPSDPETKRLADEFRREVGILASDEMGGRGLGTEGIRRAADWIEKQLKSEGLEPAFKGGYRQPFKVKIGVSKAAGNRLDTVAEEDWTPLGFSNSGDFSGDLAFVGYGIEAPSVGYQELEGIDLKGKVALMLRYEPQEKDEASPFDGKKPSRWSALRYKVLQARERGAVAVIFTTGPLQDEEKDKVPVLKNDGPESPAGIPVLQVKTSVAQKWLDRAGVNLKTFQEQVDRDLTPHSVGSVGVKIHGKVALDTQYADTENLAGLIPGKGPLASEVIVVGAHYDHLGMGGERSMRPNVVAIHNGADDNASGSVASLQIGRELKQRLAGEANHRTVAIALFSGEEVGLAGSSWFVEHPPVPIERITGMINLDMVGRLRENMLTALGSDSAPEWAGEIGRARDKAGIQVSFHGDGYGPSDQTSFYASGVPVLFLFTGAHEQYHTPDDKAETLYPEGTARVEEFATELAASLAREPMKLTYSRSGSSAPLMSGDSRGYGAYLGTIPDYRAMEATEGGVLLGDVRKGGPADLAGIRGKDRIVEMAGTRIENLYDMTYALQDHKPGETISVVVIREGKPLTLRATLGDRAAMAKDTSGPAPMPGGSPAMPATPPAGGPPAAPSPAVGKPAAAATPPNEVGLPVAVAEATISATAGPPVPPADAYPVGGPAPVPAGAPAAPPSSAAAPPAPKGGVDPFFQGRPGPGFKIGAGKPFAGSFDGERHLKEIRQLTFGGENAEPYFSPDGKQIIFQAHTKDTQCDREYIMDLDTGKTRQVSSGKGRVTCGYFDWPEADRIVYATTEGGGDACPPPPDMSQGYVWALYDSYDIVQAKPDGTGIRKLTNSPGYDAEMTWCPRGGRMIFTSVRDGDLELYTMDETGSDVKRMTREEGYDGGAFFSPDCSEIVWRASRPQGDALEEYRRLLKKSLIRPRNLEIYIMKADGTGVRQLTSNGAANFCPTFTADGTRILYASNSGPGGAREFDLYLVDKKGGEAERITTAPGFDGFPHFSPDGRYLVWSSNRADPASHETNLFIARWEE
jgi:Tol biopolymer transport system component